MSAHLEIRWTDDLCRRLAELWGQNLPASAIARQMGLSKNAVVGKAHRLELPRRPSPIKRGTYQQVAPIERIVDLMGEGWSQHAIAVRLGCHKTTVQESLNRAGVAWNRERDRGLEQRRQKRLRETEEAEAALREIPAKLRRLLGVGPAPRTCQFIEGEPSAEAACKCGAAVVPNQPYCEAHYRRCYIPRSSRLEHRRARERERRLAA